ncbi:glycosyltransferase family 15 protein [Pilatotrama ljubarskyi]|nr:glycosyltransferase family 15 protein [Pilatotrama ljubarskyi]
MTSVCPTESDSLPTAHNRALYSRAFKRRACVVNRTGLCVCVTITFLVSLHSFLRYTRPEYAHVTSVSNVTAHLRWGADFPSHSTTFDYNSNSEPKLDSRRANAVLLMLARNSELEGAVASVKELEQRFNRHYGYPWLFLNEVPFSSEFKQQISSAVSGSVSFGLIPPEHWYQPDWIDEEKAAASRAEMVADDVVYGGDYRNMCRFNSGFFYKHPLVQPYKWYWRVEPDVHFPCDISYDPFVFMEDNNKVYGFTITPHEWPKTVTSLWTAVKEFIDVNPQYLAANNSMEYLSIDGGANYNMCHFWSNFEIADMEFWRGDAYSDFFDHLESKGGFYYERWGDAPVHSIGASLFAPKDQIHFFDDIGYQHDPLQHCPRNNAVRKARNCTCILYRSYDYRRESCLRRWEQVRLS